VLQEQAAQLRHEAEALQREIAQLRTGDREISAEIEAPQAARLALDLPESWEPQGLVLLGYPAAPGQARPRRPLDKIAHFY